MNEKIRDVLNSILKRFDDPDALPKVVAMATYPRPDIPCGNWSLMNRIIVLYSGTDDARGMMQWKKAGRYIKAGTKAIYILGPMFKKAKENNEETIILSGFRPIPVFRVEDTIGEPLEYEKYEMPELPLLDIAKQWEITVKTTFFNSCYLGCYNIKRNEIALASPEESIFFHELAHAAHKKISGNHEVSPQWRHEIVAELSAQALCYLVGKQPDKVLGNSYKYIERYARKGNMSPTTACVRTIGDVEDVLRLILSEVHD